MDGGINTLSNLVNKWFSHRLIVTAEVSGYVEKVSEPLLQKSKLSDDEKGVAVRLRRMRRQERLSQQELADAIGNTRASLANYEYGLAPVPFEVGLKICRRLNVSQAFLALGKEPMRPFIPLSDLKVSTALELDFNGTFHVGFRQLLAKAWTRLKTQLVPENSHMELTAIVLRQASERDLFRMIINAATSCVDEQIHPAKMVKLDFIQGAAEELKRRLSR